MTKFKQPTLPIYKTKLPSTGKEISFRPFTVAEEKLLLLAKADDTEEKELIIEDATIQAIQNCITSGQNISDFASIDIEWMLLQLRKRSIGETIDVFFNCLKVNEGKRCNGRMETSINLNDVVIKNLIDKVEPLTIDFNGENYTMEFGPMSMGVTKNVKSIIDKNENFVNDFDVLVLYGMLEKIYTKDELWTKETLTAEEFKDFISVFTPIQKNKVKEYFSNQPSLYYNVELNCPICGNHTTYEMKTLQDFF